MPSPDPALFESHQDIVPLDQMVGRHFTIVGCGSIGTLSSRILARLGANRFHLIDGKQVELRHLNREVFSHDQIGTNKAAALSYQLSKIHPRVRCVTTAKAFDADHLMRDREDVIVLASSDPSLPQTVLDEVVTWTGEKKPLIVVARHTRLIGGYWLADLARGRVETVPKDLPWLVPTGEDADDARARIATTAHTVAGIVVQAIADRICGRTVRERVDIDLEQMIRT